MKKKVDKKTQQFSRSLETENGALDFTPTFQDNRSEAKVQMKQIEAINNSPLMTSQLKRQAFINGDAIQRAEGLEEEDLQMKQNPLQKAEGLEEEDLQMKQNPIQKAEGLEEEDLQMKQNPIQKAEGLEEEDLQMKQNPIQRAANSTGMPDDVKTKMESSLGADFSDVKIHDNSSKAPEAGALAYAQGTDLHFAPGQFKPETTKGQELLGHELTHVVQQAEGRVKPTTEVMGMPVNDDPKLETEADNLGKKAAQHKRK